MTDGLPPNQRLPTSRRGWNQLLAELGVRPSKGMGQNFLVERGIVERIVRTAGVAPGDRVVEVGPGLGILTSQLLTAGAELTAIELDRELAGHLRATFGDLPSFHLIEADALKTDIPGLLPPELPYAVVANLPYSVGTAVLMHVLEQARQPTRVTAMMQKEVAERLVARPPEMTVLSVATQVLAKPRIAFAVAPTNFMPPPKVESAVVVLEPIGQGLLPVSQRRRFFALVNAGFRHKRKQVANSIAMELDLSKDDIAALLGAAGIDPMRRAQTLSVAEWLALHRAWPHEGESE